MRFCEIHLSLWLHWEINKSSLLHRWKYETIIYLKYSFASLTLSFILSSIVTTIPPLTLFTKIEKSLFSSILNFVFGPLLLEWSQIFSWEGFYFPPVTFNLSTIVANHLSKKVFCANKPRYLFFNHLKGGTHFAFSTLGLTKEMR